METLYGLPFDTKVHRIVIAQGRNGPRGHGEEQVAPYSDIRNAVDFALPIGSIVLAMREGIVRLVFAGSSRYSRADDVESHARRECLLPNCVTIDQCDGTTAAYVHLMRETILVCIGERVRRGQPLGRTGWSGWVGAIPNLHVQVHAKVPSDHGYDRTITLPFAFDGYDGPLEHVEIAAARENTHPEWIRFADAVNVPAFPAVSAT